MRKSVPAIDIGPCLGNEPRSRAVPDVVRRTCECIGFFTIVGHGIESGRLRAGAHSDYGTLTILPSENVSAGLQVVNKAGDVPKHPPVAAWPYRMQKYAQERRKAE
ncbi:MAG: hypothetical protein ACKVQU_22285 [Burkholderiales bacterium]